MDRENAISDLEWILEDDRFGFGQGLTKPETDEEQAGCIIRDAIALLKEQKAIESINFGDRTEIMANLEGLTWDDWRMYHSDTEVQNIAKSAFYLLITLLKEQEPMKVKTDMYGNAYCPWCSTDRTIEMGAQRLHLGTHFCPYCGKAVKWDD